MIINLSNKNINLSTIGKDVKIKKVIVMDERNPNVEFLKNENIEEVCLYGNDYADFTILKLLTHQKIIRDSSKRIYEVKDLIWLIQNNKKMRFFKGKINFNSPHIDELGELLYTRYNLKIQNDQIKFNLLRNPVEEDISDIPRKIKDILDENEKFYEETVKRCLTLIAIRKFRCNYSNINNLEGNALYLAKIPKELVLQIAENIFTYSYKDLQMKREEIQNRMEENKRRIYGNKNAEDIQRIKEINNLGQFF